MTDTDIKAPTVPVVHVHSWPQTDQALGFLIRVVGLGLLLALPITVVAIWVHLMADLR